jgi:hypothetical protein
MRVKSYNLNKQFVLRYKTPASECKQIYKKGTTNEEHKARIKILREKYALNS